MDNTTSRIGPKEDFSDLKFLDPACLLLINLPLLIAFASVGLPSQGSSGNLVYVTLGHKTVGTTDTFTLYARSTDHTGAPISPNQVLVHCNGCLPVGIAPFLNGDSLIILTESLSPQRSGLGWAIPI
jgi:hypothetical protein